MTWARSLTWSRPPGSTPCFGQGVDLLEQGGGVDHHAVADDALDPRAEDAGGDQRELVRHRRRRPPYARRWPPPGSGRRRRAGHRAGRRSSPWPRHPIAGPPRKSKPRRGFSIIDADRGAAVRARRVARKHGIACRRRRQSHERRRGRLRVTPPSNRVRPRSSALSALTDAENHGCCRRVDRFINPRGMSAPCGWRQSVKRCPGPLRRGCLSMPGHRLTLCRQPHGLEWRTDSPWPSSIPR